MGTRSKSAHRCSRCRLHQRDCLCDRIQPLSLRTRVVVVMHHREWTKPTASAPLLCLATSNSEIRLRGLPDQPFDDHGLVDPSRRAALLFPSADAEVLNAQWVASDPRPITLVVPDGSWRQATKACRREPALRDLPRVVLPDLGPTRWHVRHEPKVGGLSTYEAIARALGIIEGDDVYRHLDRLFRTLVERTLAARGTSP